MKKFVQGHIICRFGVPQTLVSDNRQQFNNDDFKSWCTEMGIKNHFTTVAHPQSNDQVEVTNRTLIRALKKKVDETKKTWPYMLPEILFGYNTMKKQSTGYSPYELIYGEEAVLPVEAMEPSARRLYSNELSSIDYLKASKDMLDEKRARNDLHIHFIKGEWPDNITRRLESET